MIEQAVSFQSDVHLSGTLTLPDGDGPFPCILLIHGSGQVDRDENTKDIKLNNFKQLATFFSEKGYATCRYDKRGIGESGGSYLETGFWDLVNDAKAGLEFMKGHHKINKDLLLLLGHSEGCVIAPAVNAEHPVQGMILLAGTADNTLRATEYQIRKLEEEVSSGKGFLYSLLRLLKVDKTSFEKQQKLFDKIKQTDKAVLRVGLTKLNAKWFREHAAYDIKQDLSKITCPTLIISGEKDMQVKPQDANKIAELIGGPTEYHIIENMNHILRQQMQDVSMLNIKKIYKQLVSKPLDYELLDRLADWLTRLKD